MVVVTHTTSLEKDEAQYDKNSHTSAQQKTDKKDHNIDAATSDSEEDTLTIIGSCVVCI